MRWNNELWAALVTPFAGLGRFGSYVATFLVLRVTEPPVELLAALRSDEWLARVAGW